MGWLAVDPRNTKKVRIPDPEKGLLIEVGFWPPMQEANLRARLGDVSIFKFDPEKPPRLTSDELSAQNKLDATLLRETVRWGVRGWEAEEGEPKSTGTPKDDGFALSDESIEILHRNGLLSFAAIQVALFNTIGAEGKSGAGS